MAELSREGNAYGVFSADPLKGSHGSTHGWHPGMADVMPPDGPYDPVGNPPGGSSRRPRFTVTRGRPLDPLDAGEIARAVGILRQAGTVTTEARFASVTLNEPPKDQVAFPAPDHPVPGQSSRPGPAAAVSREAFVVWRDPRQHATCEAVVSLTAGSVLSWRPVPDAQASLMSAEFAE